MWKKLCHRIVAFSHERGEGVILWAKVGEKNVEKPLDVLQDLYQKTDLVRSILSLLLDAMTAGCDPWKTPYVVTVSHMAEMVEEIQIELLAATEELFRQRREKGTPSEMC